MIFSKKINRILLAMIIVFCVICAGFAIRINLMYTPAKLVTNDADNSITWLGCKVTALEKKIYTVEEFNAAYPDVDQFTYLTASSKYDVDKYGIVVYKVNVQNLTDEAVTFSLSMQARAEATPSMWSNGLPPMQADSTIAAGESKDMECCAMYGPTLVQASQLAHIRENQFTLVFSSYPEKVVLKF